MSQQQDFSGLIRARLPSGPISVAALIHEMRARWGSAHGVLEVHRFVAEAIRCALFDGDIEVGRIVAGRFVCDESEDVDIRIENDLMAMSEFLDDVNWYVLRKK
jgi:hypothetical protein